LRIIAATGVRLREAALSEVDRNLFRGRQCLNPYAFYDLAGSAFDAAGGS
jgi:hypothetical protein